MAAEKTKTPSKACSLAHSIGCVEFILTLVLDRLVVSEMGQICTT